MESDASWRFMPGDKSCTLGAGVVVLNARWHFMFRAQPETRGAKAMTAFMLRAKFFAAGVKLLASAGNATNFLYAGPNFQGSALTIAL
jgi:hypothetical protein